MEMTVSHTPMNMTDQIKRKKIWIDISENMTLIIIQVTAS